MLDKHASRPVPVIAALSLLLGCTLPDQPAPSTASQLVVQGIIDARSRLQLIMINRARTGSQQDTTSVGISNDAPVSGALVTLTLPNGKMLVANQFGPDSGLAVPAGAYAFYTADFGFDPAVGGTYLVHVRTATGEEVSGSTTMPTAASGLFSPSIMVGSDFRPLQDTFRLSWPRVPGAQSYEVLIRSSGSSEYRVFTDTAVSIPGTALTIRGDMIFPPGAFVDVVVSAVDQNYYDYYRARSDPFAGAPPTHLTGAVGVFGSIAPLIEDRFNVR